MYICLSILYIIDAKVSNIHYKPDLILSKLYAIKITLSCVSYILIYNVGPG